VYLTGIWTDGLHKAVRLLGLQYRSFNLVRVVAERNYRSIRMPFVQQSNGTLPLRLISVPLKNNTNFDIGPYDRTELKLRSRGSA
jgi:hypothetical protein